MGNTAAAPPKAEEKRRPVARAELLKDLLQELALYAVGAAVLYFGLCQLDPSREDSRKGLDRKRDLSKLLGRPIVHTNQYEDIIANDLINTDNMDVEFDSIGGLEGVKQALHELVILPLQRPELFVNSKLLSPQKGVLLYGPPGTGKTMLAKAVAKESGVVFINVRMARLMSKWFGDAEKLVAAVFTLAYKLQPAIIFIDEVDSFLGQRRSIDHAGVTNMKTEFMSLWDGLTTDRNAHVMVLAATNRPADLDVAILRRLPQAFEIGLPNHSERIKILKVILRGERVEQNIDYDHIAGLCEEFSGSDLLEICKRAAYSPLRDFMQDEKRGNFSDMPRPLSQADIETALETSRKAKVASGNNRFGSQSLPWRRMRDLVDSLFPAPFLEFLRRMEHINNLQPEDHSS